MPLMADDVIPISKVLYHGLVSMKPYGGLVKSAITANLLAADGKNRSFFREQGVPQFRVVSNTDNRDTGRQYSEEI